MANIIQINGYTISSSNIERPLFPFSGSAVITGSLLVSQSGITVTGSISSTGGFTGSLFGTSSWAQSASNTINAQTASFLPIGIYQITSSWAQNASQALTASFIQTAQTASYVTGSIFTSANPVLSASFARTASFSTTSSKILGGTTNYIPLWSDSVTLGSSVFYQNGTNIGLGTLTPNTTLHISASSAQPLLNIENATANGYTNMRFTGTGRKYIIGVGNASETTFGIANEFFLYDDTSGNVRMVVDDKGAVGIGTTSPSTPLDVNGTIRGTALSGFIQTSAGTTSTSPILIASGANLTNTVSGAIEYDGTVMYSTNDATSGRGYKPSTQIFRLTGTGGSITTIANFFGANSAIQLAASGVYEIEAYCYFAKITTNGSVTVTVSSSAAPVNLNGIVQFGLLTNGAATGTANQIALFNSTATSAAFGASGTLTAAQNHAFTIRLIVEANASASNLRINFTSNAGGLTPLRGSYYKVTKLPSGNVGNFTA